MRMSINQKKESLEQSLRNAKIPSKYFVQTSDSRCGNRFAIAHKEEGSLHVHTNYMTYEEFEAYVYGYMKSIQSVFE